MSEFSFIEACNFLGLGGSTFWQLRQNRSVNRVAIQCPHALVEELVILLRQQDALVFRYSVRANYSFRNALAQRGTDSGWQGENHTALKHN